MKIPKQAEEAADLAEQLHAEIFKEPAEETPEIIEPVEETVIPEDEELTFKERYHSLKGKYDNEVPRLHADVKELKAAIFEKLGEFTKPPVVEEAPEVDEELNAFKVEYGDKFVDILRRIAREETKPLLKESLTPLEKSVATVEQTQIETAQMAFEKKLTAAAGEGWRDLWDGKDPKFVEFCTKPDPSGLYTYGELLALYNKDWNAEKMGKVMKIYQDENKPPVVKEKATVPNPHKDALIAPSRSTVVVVPDTTEPIIWTGESIKAFQNDDRKGKYEAADSKRLWDDLLAAPGQNRIRP